MGEKPIVKQVGSPVKPRSRVILQFHIGIAEFQIGVQLDFRASPIDAPVTTDSVKSVICKTPNTQTELESKVNKLQPLLGAKSLPKGRAGGHLSTFQYRIEGQDPPSLFRIPLFGDCISAKAGYIAPLLRVAEFTAARASADGPTKGRAYRWHALLLSTKWIPSIHGLLGPYRQRSGSIPCSVRTQFVQRSDSL
jgi:hypothetical protein